MLRKSSTYYIEKMSAATNTLGTLTYTVAAVANKTAQQGSALTNGAQAVLNTVPVFAMIKGATSIAEGFVDFWDGWKLSSEITARRRKERARAEAVASHGAIRRHTVDKVVGAATKVSNALSSTDESQGYVNFSPREFLLRGVLKLVLGAFLVEGGLEELGVDTLSLSNTLPGLSFRFAANAWIEFGLALHEIYNATHDGASVYDEEENRIYSTAIAKLFEALAWTFLACSSGLTATTLLSLSSVGVIFLAAASVAYVYRNAPRFLSFLGDAASSAADCYENTCSSPSCFP